MKDKVTLKVFGLIKDPAFYAGKSIALDLQNAITDYVIEVEIQEMFEFDWKMFLNKVQILEKGSMWAFDGSVLFYKNEELLGSLKDFEQMVEEKFHYRNYRPSSLYEAFADEGYQKYLKASNHSFAYFDIAISGESVGRMLMELFTDICPKTCENFKALCTGERGRSQSGLKLHYQNSLIHRIVKNGWIQGGDIDQGIGNGGESIYGPVFEDESFAMKHDKPGILGMVNKGRHTNGSQFYITLQPAKWMDTKYVAFGRVIEGYDILKKLENQDTFNERPKHDCRLLLSGVICLDS